MCECGLGPRRIGIIVTARLSRQVLDGFGQLIGEVEQGCVLEMRDHSEMGVMPAVVSE